VTLSDGDVSRLADQVTTLIPTAVDVRIAPAAADDPYRWGAESWTVHFDVGPDRDDTISVWVPGNESPVGVLYRLVDGLHELAERPRLRGRPVPACLPDHHHPARVDIAGSEVLLRCPETGQHVVHLRPEVGPG
jgi:hypothetical protein